MTEVEAGKIKKIDVPECTQAHISKLVLPLRYENFSCMDLCQATRYVQQNNTI